MNAEDKKTVILNPEELDNVSGGNSMGDQLREEAKRTHKIPQPPSSIHITMDSQSISPEANYRIRKDPSLKN